jgi:hypothetical protein
MVRVRICAMRTGISNVPCALSPSSGGHRARPQRPAEACPAGRDRAPFGGRPRHRERICIVEPTGRIDDDPNLTDKKFPGNPTQSYRTRDPPWVTGEVAEWEGHSPERLKEMKDHLERLKAQGIEAIE